MDSYEGILPILSQIEKMEELAEIIVKDIFIY